jgi:hypothetical protein
VEYSFITVAETQPFQRKVVQLLSDAEKTELIAYLSAHPSAGILIKGTGGIRKLRWARGGRGKSGGVRIIYYFHSHQMPLYLLALFGKNERVNISMEEKNTLARLVRQLVDFWSQKR